MITNSLIKKRIGLLLLTSLIFLFVAGLINITFASTPVIIFMNGKEIASDTPVQLINDRFYVPIRIVVEAFGATVNWDQSNNKLMITSNQKEELHLLKLNGEPTTWPYWVENGLLFMEYRDVQALLATKYRYPWNNITIYPDSSLLSINNKQINIYTVKRGDFTTISLNYLQDQALIKFQWDSQTENLLVDSLPTGDNIVTTKANDYNQ